MADPQTLPSERIQPKSQGFAANEELVKKLDGLLKRYLTLLDQYTRAREQLTSELSAGYIQLAKANFNAPNRTRYGEDFYDERMQALRTVTIDDAKVCVSIALPASSEDSSTISHKEDGKPAPKSDAPSAPASPEYKYPTPPPDSPRVQGFQPSAGSPNAPAVSADEIPSTAKTSSESGADDKKQDRKRKQQQSDPLRWFGILVPQALRSAQGSFVAAVERTVPRTLNLAAEMRELEVEIGRARKAIRKSGDKAG